MPKAYLFIKTASRPDSFEPAEQLKISLPTTLDNPSFAHVKAAEKRTASPAARNVKPIVK